MTTLGSDEKVCPFCAETIKVAAIKCRYCGSELPDLAEQPGPADALAEVADGTEGGGASGTDEQDEPWEGRGPILDSGRLAVALLVLVLLAAATCGWALWRNQQADPQVHGAIRSTTARTAGMAAATRLTRKALSYRWKTLEADMRAAEAGMTSGFQAQYTKAMAKVHDQTLKNHVTLRASVVASSVVSASEHQVTALLFVNQVTTTGASSGSRVDQNRVVVTLTRGAGDWQISEMRAF